MNSGLHVKRSGTCNSYEKHSVLKLEALCFIFLLVITFVVLEVGLSFAK